MNILPWRILVHLSLLNMIVIIWGNIFLFVQDINLVTAQFIILVFIYANYLLEKKGRFIYPLASIIPVILFMGLKNEMRLHSHFTPLPINELSYFVLIIHNFAVIFFTQYYFLNTFNKAVDKLQSSRNELNLQVLFQKRLIAGISHDIKSPLKYLAITIRSVFKRAETERPDWVDDLNDAYKSSFKVYHFTENLLQYARVYLENDQIDLRNVNLHNLIDEKIDIFSDMARAQGCVVYNNIETGIHLKTSKSSLTVIVHNLLENAIKYTSNGSVTFKAKVSNDEFSITIIDTGRGMEPELLEWCNKIEPGNPRKIVSAFAPHQGLGLIIVYQLLRKTGGKMMMENMFPSGTSIELTFPLHHFNGTGE